MKKIVNLTNGLQATLSDEPEKGIRIAIHDQIKTFDDDISQHHRAARVTGTHPLQIIVRDSDGVLVGGLIADTYWGWLDIDDFWLEEEKRGHGLGRIMLATAEQEAINRKCRNSQLKTFSFQARGFYEKCGYQVVGELTDYPPGQALYWMRKELG